MHQDPNKAFRRKLTIAACIFIIIGGLNIGLAVVANSGGFIGYIAGTVWFGCGIYALYASKA